MTEENISLTGAEWNLMECLWDVSPRTGREAAEYLREHVGWSRSTTLTMLRRMTDKGLIRCQEEDGVKVYYPQLRREVAVIKETYDFLNRVYQGSVSMLVSAVTKKQALTKEEIDELYDILRQAEEGKR